MATFTTAQNATGDGITISWSSNGTNAVTVYKTMTDITPASLTDATIATNIANGVYGKAVTTFKNDSGTFLDKDVYPGCGTNTVGGTTDDRTYYYIFIYYPVVEGTSSATPTIERKSCLFAWQPTSLVLDMDSIRVTSQNASTAKQFGIAFPAGNTYLVAINTDSTNIDVEDIVADLKTATIDGTAGAIKACVVIAKDNVPAVSNYTPSFSGTYKISYKAN